MEVVRVFGARGRSGLVEHLGKTVLGAGGHQADASGGQVHDNHPEASRRVVHRHQQVVAGVHEQSLLRVG